MVHHDKSWGGMENSEYWIMQNLGIWAALDIECRLESLPNSQQVVFENRVENDCLMKYLADEYREKLRRSMLLV